jgi:hypothetical protein
MPVTRRALSVVNRSLAAVIGLFGLTIAMLNLNRGIWIDEFITLTWTSPGTSLREVLFLMTTRDFHPILHYGLIYLVRCRHHDIALLRFFNFLSVPLVFSAAYGVRKIDQRHSYHSFFSLHVFPRFSLFLPGAKALFSALLRFDRHFGSLVHANAEN